MSSMTFSEGLYELMDSYDGFIMDQWGVLHNGVQVYPGVMDALAHLKQHKKQIVILSNSAKRSEDNVARLEKLGIKRGLHYKEVVTAGEVTWQGLKEQKEAPFKGIGSRCYLISRPDDKALLEGLDLELVDNVEQAQFILITGFDSPRSKIEDLDPVFKKAVVKHIPAFCANPDMVTVYGHEKAIGPGAVAKHYHDMGGTAHLVGKPHKAIFRYAMKLFDNVIPSRMLMIGDSLQHDIAGAINVDIDSAFIISGIHSSAFKVDMAPGQKRKAMEHLVQTYAGLRPNWVLDSLVWQTQDAALRERERAKMKE